MGEEKAEKYLEDKGYKILEKNYRKRTGEIDLIAFDSDFKEIVFVEVKTRQRKTFGEPEESVDENKINKITETAQHWLLENRDSDEAWRIDIIAIDWSSEKIEIRHLKNIS